MTPALNLLPRTLTPAEVEPLLAKIAPPTACTRRVVFRVRIRVRIRVRVRDTIHWCCDK